MGLVLNIKPNEEFVIAENIFVKFYKGKCGRWLVRIEAPKGISVTRRKDLRDLNTETKEET